MSKAKAKGAGEEEPLMQGMLQKLGGGEGGRQNWKQRFFVLTDKVIRYYATEQDYVKAGDKPKGEVALDCYYTAPTENDKQPEFCIYAYPKNLVCRASTKDEMEKWIAELNKPIANMDTIL
eukprot:g509.t1